MRDTPALLSVATAVPPHDLDQDALAATAYAVFGDRLGGPRQLARVFANAGTRTRHAVMPMEWYLAPRGWPERTEAYLRGAGDLFVAAARRALDQAGLDASRVDAIVTVSSTGVATPSLEARLMGRLPFRSDVMRVPVFGIGCAGGVTGLALAGRLAAARPGSVVLFVAVETCTLAFRPDRQAKADVIATALFGDGAAACVVSSDGRSGIGRLGQDAVHTWPDTLDVMGWSVDTQGLGVVLAREVPPFLSKELAPAVAAMLGQIGLDPKNIDRYVCHPGGGKVVPVLEQSLHLEAGALDHERAVLLEHGNMSAPTVLFVLERLIAAGLPGRSLLLAMGPGFSAACLPLDRSS